MLREVVGERARHRVLQQHLVSLQDVAIIDLDLRRVEVHRDDADDQEHTEDYIENRDARGFRGAGGQVSPSPIAVAEDEVAAAFKGLIKILAGNVAGWGESCLINVTKVPNELRRWVIWQGKVGGLATPVEAGILLSQLLRQWALAGCPIVPNWLIQNFLQVLPSDQDDVVVLQGLLEFGAGYNVVVALAPG